MTLLRGGVEQLACPGCMDGRISMTLQQGRANLVFKYSLKCGLECGFAVTLDSSEKVSPCSASDYVCNHT